MHQLFAKLSYSRKLCKVCTTNCDIGSFLCDIGSIAHCNRNVRRRKGWSVVYSVAYHYYSVSMLFELLNISVLVLRKNLRPEI